MLLSSCGSHADFQVIPCSPFRGRWQVIETGKYFNMFFELDELLCGFTLHSAASRINWALSGMAVQSTTFDTYTRQGYLNWNYRWITIIIKCVFFVFITNGPVWLRIWQRPNSQVFTYLCSVLGAMDNASDYGSEDSRFDSWLARWSFSGPEIFIVLLFKENAKHHP